MGYFVKQIAHMVLMQTEFFSFSTTHPHQLTGMMSDGTTWGGTTAYGADNIIARIRLPVTTKPTKKDFWQMLNSYKT